MYAEELIATLQEYPRDTIVVIEDTSAGGVG